MRIQRLSLRELLLLTVCVALSLKIAVDRIRTEKIYLHVYGTAVEKHHHPYGANPKLVKISNDTWVRIASSTRKMLRSMQAPSVDEAADVIQSLTGRRKRGVFGAPVCQTGAV